MAKKARKKMEEDAVPAFEFPPFDEAGFAVIAPLPGGDTAVVRRYCDAPPVVYWKFGGT